MTPRAAWFCPSCQKYHAPHCDTCPSLDEGTRARRPDGLLPFVGPDPLKGTAGERMPSLPSSISTPNTLPAGWHTILFARGGDGFGPAN